jgi:hypothetical protein
MRVDLPPSRLEPLCENGGDYCWDDEWNYRGGREWERGCLVTPLRGACVTLGVWWGFFVWAGGGADRIEWDGIG